MARPNSKNGNGKHDPVDVRQRLERIWDTGNLSRQEYLWLTSILLSDQRLADEERRQINRVFDYVKMSRIKLVD